jgi:hypothetical protein
MKKAALIVIKLGVLDKARRKKDAKRVNVQRSMCWKKRRKTAIWRPHCLLQKANYSHLNLVALKRGPEYLVEGHPSREERQLAATKITSKQKTVAFNVTVFIFRVE